MYLHKAGISSLFKAEEILPNEDLISALNFSNAFLLATAGKNLASPSDQLFETNACIMCADLIIGDAA